MRCGVSLCLLLSGRGLVNPAITGGITLLHRVTMRPSRGAPFTRMNKETPHKQRSDTIDLVPRGKYGWCLS